MRRILSAFLFISIFIYGCKSTSPTQNHEERTLNERYDELFRDHLEKQSGKKICLISNQSGLARFYLVESQTLGENALSTAIDSTGNRLVHIFTPEHGLLGVEEESGRKVRGKKNVGISSIYTTKGNELTKEFSRCDTIVFDLPDTGVRPWTYRTILERTLHALSGTRVELILFDQVNPARHLGNKPPISKKEKRSHLGESEIPFLYTLTYAEHALFYRSTENLQTKITIIRLKDYPPKKNESTPILIPPSPNLPDERALQCYWFSIALEGTLIEEGRGTKDPFCTIGHPKFGDELPVMGGVSFTSYTFIPSSGRYRGQTLPGYRLVLPHDQKEYEPVKVACMFLEYWMRRDRKTQWLKRYSDGSYAIDNLTGSKSLRLALQSGVQCDQWVQDQEEEMEKFEKSVKRFKLYK